MPFGRVGADVAEDKAVDHQDPKELAMDRPESGAADLGAVEPGQEQENQDRGEHGDHADQLRRDEPDVEGDRAQDRVERQQIPFRHDVRRRNHRVGGNIVVGLAEEIGREEDEAEEHDHEHAHPEQVLDGVVGMERNRVAGMLDVEPKRVVGLDRMQRHQVEKNEGEDDEGQQIMEREETVQRRIVDRETAPQPGDDALADQRDRREQVGDHGRAPEAHLPPHQHVTHERGRHHGDDDDHADHPQKLARRLVGTVVKPAKHVDIDDDEERRPAVHVDVADQPAVVDVAHDPLDAVEGHAGVRRVIHGEHDAGHDHDDQRDAGERAVVPPVVQIARGRIFDRVVVHHREDRQPRVDPTHDRIGPDRCRHGWISFNRSSRWCR